MKQVLIAVIVSMAVAALACFYIKTHPRIIESPVAQETTYERVLRRGEIHCGYSVWNPLFFVDTQTGEKKGIFHDLMEEVGKRLNLKIIWQEELGWGAVVESVKSQRVDMACAGYWLHSDRIKYSSFSKAQLYAPLYVWVRQDDPRTFGTLEDLNSDQLTVGMIDGGSSADIVAARFPKARILSLPEMATNSDEIESLVTKKVDFVIDDATTFGSYIANNPNKVRNLFPDQPVAVFPVVMLMPVDWRFKEVIDAVLQDIEYDGALDAILKKYRMEHAFLRNPQPLKSAP